MSCAFFDMDGTLVNGDTNDLFFKHLLSIKLVDNSFLDPMHEFHQRYYEGKLKIEDFIAYAIKPLIGKSSEEVYEIVRPCVYDSILTHIRKGALKAIEFHRKRQDKLIIVSATVDYIIKPVADALNIDFAIAAPTERIDDKITGKLSGTVPYQDGKRQRIMQFLKENDLNLDDAYAYGDSVNDIEMFKLCAHRYAVNPTKELQENVYFKKLETLDWN